MPCIVASYGENIEGASKSQASEDFIPESTVSMPATIYNKYIPAGPPKLWTNDISESGAQLCNFLFFFANHSVNAFSSFSFLRRAASQYCNEIQSSLLYIKAVVTPGHNPPRSKSPYYGGTWVPRYTTWDQRIGHGRWPRTKLQESRTQ